jgi:2'-5' RNA ligase
MTEPAPTVRSFVAVSLPSAVQTEIAEGALALARELPRVSSSNVSWTKKAENFHVTMKFLGPVAVDRLNALAAALGEALAGVPRFELGLRGFDAFPSPRHARVLFVGIDHGREPLAAVAEVVDTVAARFGFERETRAFTGHVTIGRADLRKQRGGVDATAALAPWAERSFGTVAVDEIHIYESQLGRGGSTYVLRHRAPLAARAAN